MHKDRSNRNTKQRASSVRTVAGQPLRILLAEDDLEMRKMLSWYLNKKGCHVVECKNGNDLIKHLGFLGPLEYFLGFDLIISDIRMPGATGLQVLETAKEFEGFPSMILITAFPDKNTFDTAKRLGAAAVLSKPFDIDELLASISQIFPLGLISGKTQLPLSQQEPVSARFPLELCFRHDLKAEYIKDVVYNLAARLNCFKDHIVNCRVVIDRSRLHHQKNHIYHVNLYINVPGKTIVVKHDSKLEPGNENLYIATHIAFGTAIRRLRQYFQKCT